jgi:cytochrome c oxidase cbb3-type subunit 1
MNSGSIFSEGGIIITIVLITIPLLAGVLLLLLRVKNQLKEIYSARALKNYQAQLAALTNEEIAALIKRRDELNFQLQHNELSGNLPAEDKRGLLDKIEVIENQLLFIPPVKKAPPRPKIDPELTKLILWFIGSATFWLLFGTTVGEYLGIKFSAPDIDHISWLSFGRLRPVHTNAVFWGWASMAMIGLAYYVVPKVGNSTIYSLRLGYRSLWLINLSVAAGSTALMAGFNNGGGEYREWVWPIMGMFGAGLGVSLYNFLKTIELRKLHEIYISNWYIVTAIIFVLVIAFVAYFPPFNNGLGETIVQGYYMHQAVGMWFMLFNLGLMYYFLPQQLNKPIYSYSLGVLAFWSQILFYTLIGTHHFVFSAIPWWLQTIAIVGSAGMLIPVTAGTTNFLLTFRGSFNKLGSSYTLPFYLVGIIFYWTASAQGTAEAFRFTNLVWHFTDFTVAHSHLAMYGIISFMLWGFIYTLLPRLTGHEPNTNFVGAHFWLAFLGLLIYVIPLMIGSTLKGLSWMDGKPFVEGLDIMAPYWVWRAIGGTLMWLSHFAFAYNVFDMIFRKETVQAPSQPDEILKDYETQKATLIQAN